MIPPANNTITTQSVFCSSDLSRTGLEQFLPGFTKECSDRGSLQPEQRLVCPIEVKEIEINDSKTTRLEKQCARYGIYYETET